MPVRVDLLRCPGRVDQLPKDRADVAGSDLPCVGSVAVEHLGPVQGEKPMEVFRNTPLVPVLRTWVEHALTSPLTPCTLKDVEEDKKGVRWLDVRSSDH